MKYFIATVLVVLALVLITRTNADFFSMWLVAEPLALLFARGVSFNEPCSNNIAKQPW